MTEGWDSYLEPLTSGFLVVRASRVLELRAAIERLQAELVRAVSDWDRDHAWQTDESTSAQTWLEGRASMVPVEAARLVRTARLARTHDRVAKALAAGDLMVAQVDALARVARDREDLFRRSVDVLVDAAMAHSPGELTLIAPRWRHLADDAVPDDEPEKVHERGWTISRGADGTIEVRPPLAARRRHLVRRSSAGRAPPCAAYASRVSSTFTSNASEGPPWYTPLSGGTSA